jgi:hypothetical protein
VGTLQTIILSKMGMPIPRSMSKEGIEGTTVLKADCKKILENDKSNAWNANAKVGTRSGYKCDSQEVLEKNKKFQLLQGFS